MIELMQQVNETEEALQPYFRQIEEIAYRNQARV